MWFFYWSGFEVGFKGLYFDFVLLVFLKLFNVTLCNGILLHDVSNPIEHSREFKFKLKHRKQHANGSVDFENWVNAEFFMRLDHIFHGFEFIFWNNLEIHFLNILKFILFHQELFTNAFVNGKEANDEINDTIFVVHDKISHLFDFFLGQRLF